MEKWSSPNMWHYGGEGITRNIELQKNEKIGVECNDLYPDDGDLGLYIDDSEMPGKATLECREKNISTDYPNRI